MNRINLFRTATCRVAPSAQSSVAWGKKSLIKKNAMATTLDCASPLIFAGVLIACSLAVGCSSEKPKSVASSMQSQSLTSPVAATAPPAASTTVAEAAKPVHKKVAHRAPKTLTYSDQASGVAFQYPPKDSLMLAPAATELVSASPVPMDFIQPGGTTLAAVAMPKSAYPDSDLASAFFDVSLHPTLTAEQCAQFSVSQENTAAPAETATEAETKTLPKPAAKLMIGDLELQSAETSLPSPAGEPQRTAKYFHVFQNNTCYEFAMQVATGKVESEANKEELKPVDSGKVFEQLEKILATVKINPIAAVADGDSQSKVQSSGGASPAQ
jgi:hypothetical protein